MRYSLLPVQCVFQGFSFYLSSVYLDTEVLRNRQQTIPPPLAAISGRNETKEMKNFKE